MGMIYAALSYLLWGLFPLYWKPINHVPAFEILAHRIFWAFVFMMILLVCLKKTRAFLLGFKQMAMKPVMLLLIILASVLVSANWFIYIWAVNHGHVIESSLGYYINPLISVLLGILFLKEKLNVWQLIAFLLAAAGVAVLIIEYGRMPWIALTLALTFGFYGLTKKIVRADSILGIAYETLFVTPVALFYLIHIQVKGTAAFGTESLTTTLLLIGTGVVTAVPLLCFAEGARRISLTMIGFFQYISPTLTLILGIFVFKEPFSHTQFISFSFIWLALIVFSLSGTKFMARLLPGKRTGVHCK